MEPKNRSKHESELKRKLMSVVDRCAAAETKAQVMDCFEVIELADTMLEIAEEAYESLLVSLSIRFIPPADAEPVLEIVNNLQSRFAELTAEDKVDANWADVAAVTLVTKLWTVGEGLAVRHARTRFTQFKGLPAGLFAILREQQKRASIVSVWTAEPGACEICKFLDGSVIDNIFDDGPPAHPRCRCHIDHAMEIG